MSGERDYAALLAENERLRAENAHLGEVIDDHLSMLGERSDLLAENERLREARKHLRFWISNVLEQLEKTADDPGWSDEQRFIYTRIDLGQALNDGYEDMHAALAAVPEERG